MVRMMREKGIITSVATAHQHGLSVSVAGLKLSSEVMMTKLNSMAKLNSIAKL